MHGNMIVKSLDYFMNSETWEHTMSKYKVYELKYGKVREEKT
jgi:hypothetical protein